MDNILKTAQELGVMIATSDTFLRFQKAEEAHNSDAEALALVEEYNVFRESLMQKIRSEQPDEQAMNDFRNQLQEKFQEVQKNAIIAEYVESKKGFDELNEQVMNLIASTTSGGCDSGSCSSCSGCH
ncbi:MAG: YlbF family regulator [Hyphomonadaceae bacterium]|nr:YlbF family regulator [Clostridia bacterium]